MTKIKLKDGTIITASNVEQVNDVLKITTTELTVEELAALFSDKEKTAVIVLLTESGEETGYKEGFTGFVGIEFTADGTKTVGLLYQEPNPLEDEVKKSNEKIAELEATLNTMLGMEVTQ